MATCEQNRVPPQVAGDLRANEERYRRFSALTSDYVYQCRRQGAASYRVQWMAGAVEVITGYTQDEIFAQGCWLSLVHPEDRQRIADMLATLVPGDSKTDEFRLITKTGEIRWIRESCHCDAGANADELLLYGASQDITARKQTEQILQDKELLLRKAQRIGHLGTYDYNIVTDSWASSPELNDIFGIPATFECSFAAWLSLIHPDDRARMEKYFPELLTKNVWFDMDYRIIRPSDGTERWVYGTGEFSYDAEGNPVRMIGTIQDITARKINEQALYKSNRAYRALSACSEAVAKIHDENELFTAAARIVQQDCDFVMVWIGLALQDEEKSVSPVAQAGFEDGYLEQITISWGESNLGKGPTGTAIRTRRPCVFQDTHNDPNYLPWRNNAEKRGYRASASFPIVLNNDVYGVLNVYAAEPNAFTENEIELLARLAQNLAFGVFSIREKRSRQQAEIALNQLNRELDCRIIERTAQLESASREQEAFSYSVSHDLRAPLRHINSFSTMLQEEFGDALPTQAHNYLNRIRTASNRMGELIDDLLQLSRVGRVELRQMPVNLSHLAQQIVEMLRGTMPERTVEIQIDADMTVEGDPTLLQLALENLLGNAWKYSGQQPDARIEFGKTLIDGRDTYFVKDNGAGFDMTFVNKLFHPFQRLHGQEFEGTGIGLATVRRIIERHNGTTWGEGKEGIGATFYFTLA